MRPLGLTDTIFGNLRDAQITAVQALDGPCDLPRLLAGIEGVLSALPGFTETHMRLGVWSFARAARRAPDPVGHIAIARDHTIRRPDDLALLLDRLRRNRIAVQGPQWRIVVLNPEGTAGNPPPLSAVFMQIRHGMADGTRILQAIARLDARDPTAAHVALASRIPSVDFASLTPDVAVHDTGPITVSIPRHDVGAADVGTRLGEAVMAAVADESLFAHARPLRGNLGRTRFVARRAGGAGNHIRMETVALGRPSGGTRLTIPGLSRAQDLPLSQWAVAIAPSALARLMMRVWYSGFDGIVTLLPVPRRLRLGGRKVTAFYAAPPLWGPVPLVALVLADTIHFHVTLFPGRGFAAGRDALAARFRAALSQDTPAPAASPAG